MPGVPMKLEFLPAPLRGADARKSVLRSMQEHQPVIVLASISLAVAAVARDPSTVRFAAGAFVTFLTFLLFSLITPLTTSTRPETAEAETELWNLWLFSLLAVGFLFLGGAGLTLLQQVGFSSSTVFPILLFGLLIFLPVFLSQYHEADKIRKYTIRLIAFKAVLLLNIVLIPIAFLSLAADMLVTPGAWKTILDSFAPQAMEMAYFALVIWLLSTGYGRREITAPKAGETQAPGKGT